MDYFSCCRVSMYTKGCTVAKGVSAASLGLAASSKSLQPVNKVHAPNCTRCLALNRMTVHAPLLPLPPSPAWWIRGVLCR